MMLSRRSFAAAGLGLAAWTAVGGSVARAEAAFRRQSAVRTHSIAGTTLEQAAAPVTTSGYTRLTSGPGYPLIVRNDLATPSPTRDDRRTGLAAFVHLTDVHCIDAQSPMRLEWMSFATGSAFRPHEALGTRGHASLVERLNSLPGGPATGLPLACAVSTGDNTDNAEQIETEWFLTLLSGGRLTPTTGDPRRWEGVQTHGNSMFWQPETDQADQYKTKGGFGTIPGFFDRVQRPHTSAGLTMPWYSVFGNHDNSIQGTLPASWEALSEVYTGHRKLLGFRDAAQLDATARLMSEAHDPRSDAATQRAVESMRASEPMDPSAMITYDVTPDARRRPLDPIEYMQTHLNPQYTGPGPFGHGFTADDAAAGIGYYTFRIADGVTGIAMDSTNRAGFTNGSLDDRQWKWLHRTLRAGSSRWYQWWGGAVNQRVDDELFILFSHHTSDTMTNILLPGDGTGIRHIGSEVRSALHRYPNVIAWVNGHSHENKITPRRHDDPKRSWWEINTASHIDFPQHARLLEVADNVDGTLSLFTTMVESAAPYQANPEAGDVASMASMYRELAYNDIHGNLKSVGTPADRNTELVLAHPLR